MATGWAVATYLDVRVDSIDLDEEIQRLGEDHDFVFAYEGELSADASGKGFVRRANSGRGCDRECSLTKGCDFRLLDGCGGGTRNGHVDRCMPFGC